MTPALEEKLTRLRQIIRQTESALIAFSGGVDSSLILAVARQELGDRALACIGSSPSYPARELQAAVTLAGQIGARHRIVDTQEMLNPDYASNPSNRCYYCKTELYDRLSAIATAEGWHAILDGNNASDQSDDRPGMTAAREHRVRSPLLEAQISKPQVRALARHLGLAVWDKPAMPCLSSRVPHGTAITVDILRQIESAEDVLVELGFRQFRVRHHGDLARLELAAEDLPRAIELRDKIIRGIRECGYKQITLDLAGLRQEPAGEFQFVPLSVKRVD